MWKIDELGIVTWITSESSCRFDLRGGDGAFACQPFPDVAKSGSHGDFPLLDSVSTVRLSAIEGQRLPEASEQYVRQDRLTINYPQGDGLYAIRLSLEPMACSSQVLVFEVTVSIQTDLLDTHPMLDLSVGGGEALSYPAQVDQDNWRADLQDSPSGANGINLVNRDDVSVAILLDRHDAPTTTSLSDAQHLRLRLFGDFLEKGVIRTARPWIVMDRSGQPIATETLEQLFNDLEQRPLPLAT